MPFDLRSLATALFGLIANILCAVLTTVAIIAAWHGKWWPQCIIVSLPTAVLWAYVYNTTKLPLLFKYVREKIDQAKDTVSAKIKEAFARAKADKL